MPSSLRCLRFLNTGTRTKMGQALVVKDKEDNIFLQGRQGKVRPLPQNLYDKLAPVSHDYDPKKDFIGYVDPVAGVVIVDASAIEEKFNETAEEQEAAETNAPDSEEPPTLKELTPHDSVENITEPVMTSSDEKNAKGSSSKKTKHQLAYELINGTPVPDDEFRPISGFGIKQGELLYNSTTFNAFQDDFHTDDREMGELEKNKLQALLDQLNEAEKSKGPHSLTPSQCW